MGTLTGILGLLVLPAALTSAVQGLEVGQAAPSFELKDQFGKMTRLMDLKGEVVIIVAATRDSGEMMGPWIDNLKKQYAGPNKPIRILGLIDLHDLARLFRGVATSRIKKETKDPVLIDFSGKTGKLYDVSDRYPVVVVIDKESVVRNVQKTKYNKEAYGTVTSAVDQALQE